MPEQPVTTKRQKPITLLKLIIVLVLGIVLVGFLWKMLGAGSLIDKNQKVTPTASPEEFLSNRPSFGSMGTDEDVNEVIIIAREYSFNPNSITVSYGEKVRLVVESTGGTHDLVIEELGVSTQLVSDGHKAWVDFVPDKKGTFTFYCSLNNHREMGMVGTITVE